VPGVAGVDEAGRGPLAGPVVAAAVIIAPRASIVGIKDSKLLSARKRETLAEIIRAQAIAWSIGAADPGEIDELNILQATLLAMRRAVLGLAVLPDRVRIDGNRSPEFGDRCSWTTETVIGGDRICPVIGAASILAKVHRDKLMFDLHSKYPEYGFDRHKGYPTADHRAALERYGPCAQHRMSFRPVRAASAAISDFVRTNRAGGK